MVRRITSVVLGILRMARVDELNDANDPNAGQVQEAGVNTRHFEDA